MNSQSKAAAESYSEKDELSAPVTENAALREFGQLAPLMSNPLIEEIWLNSPHRIFVAKSGMSELTNIVMTTDEVRDFVKGVVAAYESVMEKKAKSLNDSASSTDQKS